MILKVGLTGGTASGKSTVARLLEELGCFVIDADRVVHDLYRPGEAGYHAVVGRFGKEILAPDGMIDRQKLAALAFQSPESSEELNALIHPLVIAREKQMLSQEKAGIVVVEATLLLEAGGRDRYDKIVVVEASPELALKRAVERGMKRQDAQSRISRQMASDERRAFADYIIQNDGDIKQLAERVRQLHAQLQNDLKEKRA